MLKKFGYIISYYIISYHIICLGGNLTKLAIPLLQDLANRRQTSFTEEETRVAAARKVASALKAKATRAKNKQNATVTCVASVPTTTEIMDAEDTSYWVDSSSNSLPTSLNLPTFNNDHGKTKRKPKDLNIITPISKVNESSINAETSTDISFKDNESFLKVIKPKDIYTWVYISLSDEKPFHNLLTKVQPLKINNQVTTFGIIISEKNVIRRSRDPRLFNVQMLGFDQVYEISSKDLLITKCRHCKM